MKKAIVILGIIGFPFMIHAQSNEDIKSEGLICEDAQYTLHADEPSYNDKVTTETQETKKSTGKNKKHFRKSLFADCDGIDFKNTWGILNKN